MWTLLLLVVIETAANPFLEHWRAFNNPWLLSVKIAVVTLLLVAWIPLIEWRLRQRRGIAWSVHEISVFEDDEPSIPDRALESESPSVTAALAIWNRGASPERSDLTLSIEGTDPETRFLDLWVAQSNLSEPIQQRPVASGHRVDLQIPELGKHQGMVIHVRHTGEKSTDLHVVGNVDRAGLHFFGPDLVVSSPLSFRESWRQPIWLLTLAIFVIIAVSFRLGHYPLSPLIHSIFTTFVVVTIFCNVVLSLQNRSGSYGLRLFPYYVPLPRGLERFFENVV